MNCRRLFLLLAVALLTSVVVSILRQHQRPASVKPTAPDDLRNLSIALEFLRTLQEAYSTIDRAGCDLFSGIFEGERSAIPPLEEIEAKHREWRQAVNHTRTAINGGRKQSKELEELRASLARFIEERDGLVQRAVGDLKEVAADRQKGAEERRLAKEHIQQAFEHGAAEEAGRLWKVWQPFMEEFRALPANVWNKLAPPP